MITRMRKSVTSMLKYISIVLFAFLVIVVFWQVFTRQVLHNPSTWSTTVSQYTFVWLALFSASFVFAERGHVAVDIVQRMVLTGVKRVMVVLVQAAILAFALIGLLWGGIRGVALTWTQNIPGLPVTVGQMYIALPIAGFLIAIVALDDLVRALTGEELESLEPVDAEIDNAMAQEA